jgi:hypothetical protein
MESFLFALVLIIVIGLCHLAVKQDDKDQQAAKELEESQLPRETKDLTAKEKGRA